MLVGGVVYRRAEGERHALALELLGNVARIRNEAGQAVHLGLKPDDLLPYAVREETRREHLVVLRGIYGYRMFKGRHVRRMKSWLAEHAEAAGSGEDLVRGFVEECRRRLVILPAMSTIERLCADALVTAERRIDARIAARLDGRMRTRLDSLLNESADGHTSRFIWLRQFQVGNNSADANRLLDRLELLQELDLPAAVLDGVPPHGITRLRRQAGEANCVATRSLAAQ